MNRLALLAGMLMIVACFSLRGDNQQDVQIGRFQLITGTADDIAGHHFNYILRIDSSTGRVWKLMREAVPGRGQMNGREIITEGWLEISKDFSTAVSESQKNGSPGVLTNHP